MSQQTQKSLILVDGSSFLFRAYHAIPPLTNPQGEPTNAIYGVSNMLRKLIADYQSEYITVVFDAPGKTFRNDLYDQYKAHRPPMPEDLRVQIKPLHELIRNMGLPLIMESGVEADDVLGALAQFAEKQGFKVIISTGDKDMAQLVTENIILENTMSNTRMDIQGVINKFGVKPEQIIDYLALMGDSSDNIPGIPKVGPKTAAKWLEEYQTLENLAANADKITGKIGESLRANLHQLPLAKQLTTIKCDLDLPYTMDDLKRCPINIDELKNLLATLGFLSWFKTLDTNVATTVTIIEDKPIIIDSTYDTVLTYQQFGQWLELLENAELFAFDTETTSLDYNKAEIVGVSFSVIPGKAAYIPLAHNYTGVPDQLDRTEILEKLRPLLENSHKAKLGQNLKYDAHVLTNHGITLR
ncbi:MAG: 5'-3' exonuclease H3TH domain-containing protein, partial [Methylococcaceae bacterium]